jgi:hypothetical protein
MTQKTAENTIAEVTRLMGFGPTKTTPAFELLLDFISDAPREDLERLRREFDRCIDKFFEKKRKTLIEALNARLTGVDQRPTRSIVKQQKLSSEQQTVIDTLRSQLKDIEERFIFDWPEIRIRIANIVDKSDRTVPYPSLVAPVFLDEIYNEFSNHVKITFQKGYNYSRFIKQLPHSQALSKAVSGFQRLAETIIQAHAEQLASEPSPKKTRFCRQLTSRLLRATFDGSFLVPELSADYARAIARSLPHWGYILLYTTADDLDCIRSSLKVGLADDFDDLSAEQTYLSGLNGIVSTIDSLSEEVDKWVLSVSAAVLNFAQKDAEIRVYNSSIRDDFTPIQIGFSFSSGTARRLSIQRFLDRKYNLVVWVDNSNPKVETAVYSEPVLNKPAVFRFDGSTQSVTEAVNWLKYGLAEKRVNALTDGRPITFNFAASFPLDQPKLNPAYKVYRPRIHELALQLASRTGVMTLCSVRRSGKTTASEDMKGPHGNSSIVYQSAESTNSQANNNFLAERLKGFLVSRQPLPTSFLKDLLDEASPLGGPNQTRSVLIIDEYERLFGLLDAYGSDDKFLLFSVVQPLLDQFVSYSRENLIVFLGQQPDAYHIFMDLNQLAPYVRQEQFPLFSFDGVAVETEFYVLLRKVFTDRVNLSPCFVRAVFCETGGHPYLTVNLLTEFFEWLIEKRVVLSKVALDESMFYSFSNEIIQPGNVFSKPCFSFFRNAASEAMSPRGLKTSPWLHYCYMALNGLHLCGEREATLSTSDLRSLMTFNSAAEGSRRFTDFADFCSSAHLSNFLNITDGRVRPRIRLLSRIAGSVQST